MIRSALHSLLSQRWLQAALRAVYGYFLEEISRIRHANPEVGEINPLPARSVASGRSRVTLLLPGISERHYFGGIATAMAFLEGFRPLVDDLRIVVTDESELADSEKARFPDWQIGTLETDAPGYWIIPAGGREQALSMRPNECVIATAWWTAHMAARLTPDHPFIYLIQDFEPGFYPWSARYALAAQTYANPTRVLPVCNSQLLRDFMAQNQYIAADALCFDPVFNPDLKAGLNDGPWPREKRVLVYGRPTVERNAFPLVIDVLRQVVATGASAGWQFISVGEPHADIGLGDGLVLESHGKLSLSAYAAELRRCYAGVSLMISPHPSYPPLEMAAAGLQVITNQYANKDLTQWGGGLQAFAPGDTPAMAAALSQHLAHYDERPIGVHDGGGLLGAYQTGEVAFAPLAEKVWARWLSMSAS